MSNRFPTNQALTSCGRRTILLTALLPSKRWEHWAIWSGVPTHVMTTFATPVSQVDLQPDICQPAAVVTSERAVAAPFYAQSSSGYRLETAARTRVMEVQAVSTPSPAS